MFAKLRSLFGGKAAQPASDAPPDARALFSAEVEAYLHALPGVSAVKALSGAYGYDVVSAAGTMQVYLDNAFAETRECSPEERHAKIALFFSMAADAHPDDPWDVARDSFVPVLRGATYGLDERWIDKPAVRLLRRPFLPFVDLAVAVDRPTSMAFVTQAMAEGWSVDAEQVFHAASARLPLLADPNVDLYDETHGPLWIVASHDTYEASRLVVPGWLASFRGKVDGNPIAIVPERSTLMIGGDGRPEMIERLLDKGEREFGASNRRLSPALYTADAEGRVVPYVRGEGDALAIKVKAAHERLASHEYRHQKQVLEAVYAKNGPDVFVASYVVHAAEGGMPRSLCVWTKDVRSYLPRTESVVLVVLGDKKGDKPKATVQVPFTSIEDRLTAVPGLHPALYETTGEFPGQGELYALAAPRS